MVQNFTETELSFIHYVQVLLQKHFFLNVPNIGSRSQLQAADVKLYYENDTMSVYIIYLIYLFNNLKEMVVLYFKLCHYCIIQAVCI